MAPESELEGLWAINWRGRMLALLHDFSSQRDVRCSKNPPSSQMLSVKCQAPAMALTGGEGPAVGSAGGSKPWPGS